MKVGEAISRIQDDKLVHKMNEPQAVHIHLSAVGITIAFLSMNHYYI